MTAYEVLCSATQQSVQGTDIALDWLPGSVSSNIECKPDFFRGWRPTREAADLFLLGAAAYSVDKLEARARARDAWTRELGLRWPTSAPSPAKDELLARALHFLTGDNWRLASHEDRLNPLSNLLSNAATADAMTSVGAVSLFSGGLDSLCGVVDLLESDSKLTVALVSHYDGGQATSKQEQIYGRLAEYYGRDRVLLRRLWVRPAPANAHQRIRTPEPVETTTRGRSFLFLTAALSLASAAGPTVPVYLPENGYIALNVPLTRARTGSASTRTTHPHYLKLLGAGALALGVPNPMINPYQYRTKGQMLQESKNPDLLKSLAPETVSCSHPEAARMQRRAQGNCGYCFPCLIRRASLATVGWDTEEFAWDVLSDATLIEDRDKQRGADLRAVLNGAFARRPDSDLLRNAPLPPGSHSEHLRVWRQGNDELRSWLTQGAAGPLARVVRDLT